MVTQDPLTPLLTVVRWHVSQYFTVSLSIKITLLERKENCTRALTPQ